MGTVIIALMLSVIGSYFGKLDFFMLLTLISLALELQKKSTKSMRMIKKGFVKIRKRISKHRPIKVCLSFKMGFKVTTDKKSYSKYVSSNPRLVKVHLCFKMYFR